MDRHIDESANISGDARVGFNCVIMDGVTIGPGAFIGNNVVIHPGTTIGSNVSIGDNAVLGRQPRAGFSSKRPVRDQAPLRIGDGVVIGTSAIIYAGTEVEDRALIADLVAIREGCVIGENARIGRTTTMENNARIGKNTVVQTACHITGNCVIEDRVFLGPEVCTMNDKYMSRRAVELKGPHIKTGASVGSNSTLLPGITIGENSIVGAGAIVTKDVPDGETWIGAQARRRT